MNVSPALRRHAAVTLLSAVALAIGGVARANAATLTSAAFHPPTLRTQWNLDSGDCASAVSISNSRKVDDYRYFSGWHVGWSTRNCLATSNLRTFSRRAGAYRVLGHRLPAGTYWVQVRYCHDSDFSGSQGNYYCTATDARSVRIPRPQDR